MTKRNCFVTDVGDAIEALATALDPERKPPFKGDILDLLEWATKDMLGMSKELATLKNEIKLIGEVLNDPRVDLTMTMSEDIQLKNWRQSLFVRKSFLVAVISVDM